MRGGATVGALAIFFPYWRSKRSDRTLRGLLLLAALLLVGTLVVPGTSLIARSISATASGPVVQLDRAADDHGNRDSSEGPQRLRAVLEAPESKMSVLSLLPTRIAPVPHVREAQAPLEVVYPEALPGDKPPPPQVLQRPPPEK